MWRGIKTTPRPQEFHCAPLFWNSWICHCIQVVRSYIMLWHTCRVYQVIFLISILYTYSINIKKCKIITSELYCQVAFTLVSTAVFSYSINIYIKCTSFEQFHFHFFLYQFLHFTFFEREKNTLNSGALMLKTVKMINKTILSTSSICLFLFVHNSIYLFLLVSCWTFFLMKNLRHCCSQL